MEILTAGRSIADEIQLSLAPVFLLTAIAAFLTVLTSRLGRAADHARLVAARARHETATADDAAAFAALRRRIDLLRRSIGCTVVAAFIVCLVIMLIFFGEFTTLPISAVVGGLFMLTMVMLMLGFGFFFVEIRLSTQQWNREFWD